MCEQTDWYKCHGEGWGDLLVPEAYAHPAKVKRALARKIYAHLFERGYIEQGAIIVDPFAGIGGFALHAMQNGLHFIGMELEQPFVDLGQACDCTGVSKEDWIRYQGRLDKVRYRDGRHICPRCIAEAGRVLPSLNGQTEMFGLAQTTSYRRNSGKIPRTDPHHYSGNIETWMGLELPGTALIVQGDSRNLVALLEGVGGLVSSPPYAESTIRGGTELATVPLGTRWATTGKSVRKDESGYGTSKGQLAAMPPGSHAAVVSSPPHLDTLASDDPDKRGGLFRDPKRRNDKTLTAEYGRTPGQLGAMPPGDISIVSSPPYAKTHVGAEDNPYVSISRLGDTKTAHLVENANYGDGDGQLANLPVGDAIVSSPPWEESISRDTVSKKDRVMLARELKKSADCVSPIDMEKIGKRTQEYGQTNGQLGTETGTTFWQAARTIMEQCYQVLAPGAVAVWVCKRFVRDKKIVEFSKQWAALGESCGFETVEWIRSWLVEDRGAQFDLFGELHEKTVERKSFFRRLYENKYPGNSIDWEDVIIQRKT